MKRMLENAIKNKEKGKLRKRSLTKKISWNDKWKKNVAENSKKERDTSKIRWVRRKKDNSRKKCSTCSTLAFVCTMRYSFIVHSLPLVHFLDLYFLPFSCKQIFCIVSLWNRKACKVILWWNFAIFIRKYGNMIYLKNIYMILLTLF
jgi:hypothetical protein